MFGLLAYLAFSLPLKENGKLKSKSTYSEARALKEYPIEISNLNLHSFTFYEDNIVAIYRRLPKPKKKNASNSTNATNATNSSARRLGES